MKGIIYRITNKVNGKSYIGQTRYTLEFRWRQHIHKKDNVYFHNAIHKYGEENFEKEVLEECEAKDLDSREIFYIAKYDTFNKGYNLTIGGDGCRRLNLDDKYDEIQAMYKSGFSPNKIATLYNVDKASIVKILRALGVKIRDPKKISVNRQEFLELVQDYQTGYSLKQLAKRYDCSAPALKEYLVRKGVDLRERYSIYDDSETQEQMVADYLQGDKRLVDIERKYHISYATLKKVLSLHGISTGRKAFKMSEKECLECISDFNQGVRVQELARKYEVDKCTIYSMLKRYHVNYLTV